MNRDRRDDLIDAYFAALDDDDVDGLTPRLAEEFTYVHPDTSVAGVEGMCAFFHEREPQDTTHEIRRRIHAEEASVVEGRLTGELADGTPREGDFCDVFSFDEADEQLTRIDVYARL